MRPTVLIATLLAFAAQGTLAQGLPQGKPEELGLSTSGLATLDQAMEAYVRDGKLPGLVVAIVKDGQVVHWKAFGQRLIEANAPMKPNDLFRIYSMTKPITSAAAMILVEEGKIGLEEPVAKYLPEFADVKVWTPAGLVPPRRPISIRDLLRHTSGLTYGFFGESPVDSLYRKADLQGQGVDLNELVHRVARLPLLGQPGEVWNYGFSTDVLGRVIEVVSGISLDRFFSTRIFQPLGMSDTFFEVPTDKRSRFTGYYARPTPGKFYLADSPDSGNYTRPPKMLSGGGGLVSSTADYLTFCQMVLNGGELKGVRILKPETVTEMLRNQIQGELVPAVSGLKLDGTGFGLGFNVIVNSQSRLRGSLGTASWGGYANTFFFIDPVKRLTAVVMTQFYPFAAYPLEADFRRLVYQSLR